MSSAINMVDNNISKQNLSNKNIAELCALLDEIQAVEFGASELLSHFRSRLQVLPAEQRVLFYQTLMQRYEVRASDLKDELKALKATATQSDPLRWSSVLTALRRKLESPRLQIYKKVLNSSGGLKFLLDLRADILATQRRLSVDLDPLDEEIASVFDSWFHQGLLFLKEITQDSPYRVIRFLVQHDMVHPMTRLEEMGSRLGEDRHCYALYHRAMPEEPIVFIEIALTKGISRTIHDVLDVHGNGGKRATPDTAIFYSINNTQNGLSGIGLGKVLVFQVVEALRKSSPGIKTFATLSPIPGFWKRYLRPILQGNDEPFVMKQRRLDVFFTERNQQQLSKRLFEITGQKHRDFASTLLAILSDYSWIDDQVYNKALKKPLRELTYHYIVEEKNSRGRILNPVANFHMGNGATITKRDVNFAGNRLPRGVESSCGMMANYIYSSSLLGQFGRTVQELLPWSF